MIASATALSGDSATPRESDEFTRIKHLLLQKKGFAKIRVDYWRFAFPTNNVSFSVRPFLLEIRLEAHRTARGEGVRSERPPTARHVLNRRLRVALRATRLAVIPSERIESKDLHVPLLKGGILARKGLVQVVTKS